MADYLVSHWRLSTDRASTQRVLVSARVVAGATAQDAVNAAGFASEAHGPDHVGNPVITADLIYTPA